jgi:predicted GIY-YIG superfamily endonuclease
MSKRFVYVLKNSEVPPRYYTGISSDVAPSAMSAERRYSNRSTTMSPDRGGTSVAVKNS